MLGWELKMDEEQELKKQLEELRENRDKETRIKILKKQIQAEKFAQTKMGKAFNVVGNAGKKILTPPKKSSKQLKNKIKKTKSFEEIIAGLPA